MSSALQPSLPGARVKVFAPMVGIDTAMAMLPDHTEDDVLAMIEDGQLPWAWNIASADATARCIRILAVSIVAIQVGGERCVLTFDQVMALIIPPAAKGKPFLTLNPQIITASRMGIP